MNAKEVIKELIKNNPNVSTVAELERLLNISNGTINKWDKAKPSVEALSKVADYFDVSVDYLLGRKNQEATDEKLNQTALMFRVNESEIPEDKREEFRKDVEKYLDFLKTKLND